MTVEDTAAPAASTPTVPIVASPPTSPPAKRVKIMSAEPNEATIALIADSLNAPPYVPAAALPDISLQVQKLSPEARLPTRGSAFAAGYDLYAARAITIPHLGKALVDTDLAIAVPPGTYGRIAPRSGLAAKHFIDTGAGVIDADYRGHVRVLLFNHDPVNDFAIAAGDRVAQLVLERIVTPDIVEVAQLDASVRGAGGFGSTGGFGGDAAAPQTSA